MSHMRPSAGIYAEVRHLQNLFSVDGVRRSSAGRNQVELVTLLDVFTRHPGD